MRRSRLAPVERLHDSITALARDPILFTDMGVRDDFEGRFEILVLHFALVLRRLGQLPPPAGDLAQELTDCFFKHLDEGLREIGVGDLGVPKRMKRLAKAFYGRAAAYEATLAARDRAGLVEALRRNVFAGEEGDAPRLAARVEAFETGLSRLELEALLADGIVTLGRQKDRGRRGAVKATASHARQAFSRPLAVVDIPRRGLEVAVEADEEERARIAAEFELPALSFLKGAYRVLPTAAGLRVTGEVTAHLSRACVVSLEPFETDLHEKVELAFATLGEHASRGELKPAGRLSQGGEITISPDEEDPPELIIDGKVDLGAVTLEFLALGLDPYPRKPGVELAERREDEETSPSPFAMLAKLGKMESGEA